MKPGRDLDVLVGEKVMDWQNDMRFKPGDDCPFYSTDIAAAWEVVAKMKSLGWGYVVECTEMESEPTAWFLKESELGPHKRFRTPEEMEDGRSATASTAPHAICLAALKTVGHL